MADGSSSDTLSIETPRPPVVTQYGSGNAMVSYTIPRAIGTEVKEIEISYKESSKRNYRTKCVLTPQNETLISNLVVDRKYSFHIQARNLDDDVVSNDSPTTEIDIIESENNDPMVPGQPFLRQRNGSHSITLKWSPPEHLGRETNRYEIFVFQEGHDTYSLYSDTNEVTIDNLKQMCSYTFAIRSERKIGEEMTLSELSKESEEIQTDISIGSYLKQHEDTICEKFQRLSRMSLHKIKCYPIGEIDHENKIRHVLVGQGKEMGHANDKRYVLLFGQTGAGKSTIIDLIVNHVYDVAWQDDFRLKAVDKMEDEENRDQVDSQTQWITCYEMKRREKSILDFDLVVIDTPGFNSLNKKGNVEVKKQFQTLILEKRIQGLHAICFVAQSHTGRLTENEEKLSKIISEIFGKDIKESIFIFATCADSTYPMVGILLRSLGVRFHDTFKFNNTPFTLEKQMSRAEEQKQHWIEGRDTILKFFDKVEGLHLKSLKFPQEKINRLEQLKQKLQLKKQDADDALYGLANILNKSVYYTKEKQPTPRGRNATVCNSCEHTCCHPCNLSWINKRLCWKIEFYNGICTVCKPSCTTKDHESGPYTYERVPNLRRKQVMNNQVDPDVLSSMKERISKEGRWLTNLFFEVHKIETKIDQALECEMGRAIDDTIDTIIKAKRSKAGADFPLIEMILQKCLNEAKKPEKQRWNKLKDLEWSI